MRKLGLAVVALVVVLVVAIGVLWSNLDGLVKTAIETVGTKVAGVQVSVAKVKLDISNGKAAIEGLSIANPKGFNAPNAMTLGSITVALDPQSATKNPILIHSVDIVAPQVTYEVGANGSNIDAIKKNVDGFVAAQSKGAAKAETKADAKAESAASDSGDGKKLVVEKVAVTDGKVTLAAPVPGAALSAAIPTITLHDIGKSSGGASAGEVAGQVLNAITNAALKSGSGLGVSAAVDALKGAGGDAVKGATDQLKGLFGK